MAFDPASYLAALIDGEGTIGCYKTKSGHSCRISICNTDTDIIQAAQLCYEQLGIPCVVRQRQPSGNRKTAYNVDVIGGFRSFQLVADLIPIKSSKKQNALQKAIKSRKWKIMPDRNWFFEHYHTQQLSISQLAKLLHCAPMTAYNWLRRHRIETRPLSLAAKLDWEKRGERRR